MPPVHADLLLSISETSAKRGTENVLFDLAVYPDPPSNISPIISE
jgi:hypothetical protein